MVHFGSIEEMRNIWNAGFRLVCSTRKEWEWALTRWSSRIIKQPHRSATLVRTIQWLTTTKVQRPPVGSWHSILASTPWSQDVTCACDTIRIEERESRDSSLQLRRLRAEYCVIWVSVPNPCAFPQKPDSPNVKSIWNPIIVSLISHFEWITCRAKDDDCKAKDELC